MKNETKKKKKTFFHDEKKPTNPSMMYSEVMRSWEEKLLSLNLITPGQLMKEPPSQPDDTIKVTFIKKSKK
jgi:hypothetical protein